MRRLLYLLTIILAATQANAQSSEFKDRLAILTFNPNLPEMKAVFPETARHTKMKQHEMEETARLLKQCVDEYNSAQMGEYEKWSSMDATISKDEFFINLDNYRLQYLPVLNGQNEKEVWVNAFCYGVGEKWQKEIVKVDDGGKCFFNLRINLSAKTCSGLTVNAP